MQKVKDVKVKHKLWPYIVCVSPLTASQHSRQESRTCLHTVRLTRGWSSWREWGRRWRKLSWGGKTSCPRYLTVHQSEELTETTGSPEQEHTKVSDQTLKQVQHWGLRPYITTGSSFNMHQNIYPHVLFTVCVCAVKQVWPSLPERGRSSGRCAEGTSHGEPERTTQGHIAVCWR